MNEEELKNELIERFLELPYTKRRGKNQVETRCVFCGDSKKHSNSTHFSIKINTERDEPILFNCFKCHVGGVLTPSILKEFDIRNLELSSAVLSYNNKAVKKTNKKLGIRDNDIKLKLPIYKNITPSILRKKQYIENRLGVEFTLEDLYGFKTIFNIKDFIKVNALRHNATDEKLSLLNDEYVCFMSSKNEFLVCRNILENTNPRYDKYSVFYSLDNTRQFYTIPNTLDLVTNETVELIVAEGVFDILGIYHHIFNKNSRNKLYVAICGSGFMNVIKYFIKIGVFGTNTHLKIFSDNDKNLQYYNNISRELGCWFNSIEVFYNTIGKDYGVIKNKIKLSGGYRL